MESIYIYLIPRSCCLQYAKTEVKMWVGLVGLPRIRLGDINSQWH